MSFVTYNYIAVMGPRPEVLRFKQDACRSVAPSQRSPGFSRVDFSIEKLFKKHSLADPTGQGFPADHYHYVAKGWRIATWHEFVRQLYVLEVKNYEVHPFLVPLSRVYCEVCFVVSELSLDLGEVSSTFVTRGRVSTWVLPDDRRSVHWKSAAAEHGIAQVEDAYEDDDASNSAEFAMLDEAVEYWDKRVLRVLRRRA